MHPGSFASGLLTYDKNKDKMAETLILTVDIDLKEGIKSVEELIDRQTDLKQLQIDLQKEQRQLRKDIKEANEAFDDTGQVADNYDQLTRELVQVENQLRKVRSSQRLVNKELEAAGTGEDSFRRMSVEAKKLDERLRRLDPGDAGFEDLRRQVEEANQKLIDFDQNSNNFRSSVGRYSQAILDAFQKAGISIDSLDKENLQSLRQRQQQLIQETRELGERYRNSGKIGEASLRMVEAQIEANNKELNEINKELKVTETRLKTIGGIDLSRFAEGFASTFTAQAALDGLQSLISGTKEYFQELLKIEDATRKVFTDPGEDIDRLAAKIQATANTFDQDYNEVLRAANVLTETFGGSGVENVDRINNLLIRGANLSGDFLDQISEYSTFFDQGGASAEEFLSVLVASEDAGIFNDKAPDAIKEAFLAIREGTKSTRSALAGIGIDYEAEIQKINEGNGTFNDLLSDISGRLGELDTFSPEVGAVLADVFKGAGEEAGTFVQDLDKIFTKLNEAPEALTPYQRSQEAILQIQEQLATAAGAVTDALLPVVSELLELFVSLGEVVGENAETIGVFVTTIVAAIAAQKGYNAVTQLNLKNLKLFSNGFKGLNTVMRANPIGVIVTLLGVLATAFTFVSNNIEKTRNFVDDFFDGLDNLLSFLGPFGTFFRAQFSAIRSVIGVVIDAIANFQATLAGLRAGAGAVLQNIVDGFLSFGNSVQLVFQRVRSSLNIGGIFGDEDEIQAEITRLEAREKDFEKAGETVAEAYARGRNQYLIDNPVEEEVIVEDEIITPETTGGSGGGAGGSGGGAGGRTAGAGSTQVDAINQQRIAENEQLKTHLTQRGEIISDANAGILESQRLFNERSRMMEADRQADEEEALRRHQENLVGIQEESFNLVSELRNAFTDTTRQEERLRGLDEEIQRLEGLRGAEDALRQKQEEREEVEAKIEARKEAQARINEVLANTEQLLESIRAANDAAERIRDARQRIRDLQSSGTSGIKAILKAAASGGIFGILGLVAAVASGIAAIRGIIRGISADGDVIGVSEVAAKGTILRGRTHRQGGIPIRVGRRIIEAEDRETILTRGVQFTSGGRDAASALNELHGGKRLPGTSANYGTVMAQMSSLIGGPGLARQTYPKLPGAPIMASGGIFQGANQALDTAGLGQNLERIAVTNEEILQKTNERELVLPVIETRRQLNNVVNYESARRN